MYKCNLCIKAILLPLVKLQLLYIQHSLNECADDYTHVSLTAAWQSMCEVLADVPEEMYFHCHELQVVSQNHLVWYLATCDNPYYYDSLSIHISL